jgi:hypothetical protein
MGKGMAKPLRALLKALRQKIETAPGTTFKARKATRNVTLNKRDFLFLTSKLGHTAWPSR